MTRKVIFISALIFGVVFYQGVDAPVSQAEDPHAHRIRSVLDVLNQLPSGAELLRKTQTAWKVTHLGAVAKKLTWGEVSRTDTVLTRHYNPVTGQEDREREVMVYLRKEQSESDLLLDMAHELVHATSYPGFDPYDSGLTPGQYISAALEGAGGEIDAVYYECAVAAEYANKTGRLPERCREYVKWSREAHTVRVNREQIYQDFYHVGKWHSELIVKLGKEVAKFPLLSTGIPKFYSSTGRTPYPFALLKEFEEITEVACNNTKRRTDLEAKQFFLSRCQN